MSVLPFPPEKGAAMEVGLELQDRPWQHVNGENSRASYHALPPIAALTSYRPTSARREDHVFSIPNPPKPAGLSMVSQRAPTPFADSQFLQQRGTPPELTTRTSPAPSFPSSSPKPAPSSDGGSPSISLKPVIDPVTSTFQSVDQRPLASPHSYQNMNLPLSEAANYPSSTPVEGSRSSTPQVPVPSPSGSFEVQRSLVAQQIEYGRNTPGALQNVALGKDPSLHMQRNSPVGVAGYSVGSPRSFTPRNSPVPSPNPRSQGEKFAVNQMSPSPATSRYNPASVTNLTQHANPQMNPRSYSQTLPSISSTRSFGSLQTVSSSEVTSRYHNIALDNLRNVAQNPTSYDNPRSAAHQTQKQSIVAQLATPNMSPAQDQNRPSYGDRPVRYAAQPTQSDTFHQQMRQNERVSGYFNPADTIVKSTSITTTPHSSFVPSLHPRTTENLQVSGDYANFQGHHSSRQNYQSFSKQNPSHHTSASLPSTKQQLHPPPPKAVPYFRTDTSSVVWTTPSTNVSVSSRPYDSHARQFPSSKSGVYQGHSTVPDNSIKSPYPQQQVQNLYQQGVQHMPRQASQVPSSREQLSSRNYSTYPTHSHPQHAVTTSTLPRNTPPSVVNVTSTFTPRFSSHMNQSNASLYSPTQVPSSLPSDQTRSSTNYSNMHQSSKQPPTSSNSASSSLPRVNFPSPTAVSFDTTPALQGPNAYAPTRSSGMVAVSSSQQPYNSGVHPSPVPLQSFRDIKVSLTASPQPRHSAYSQVQSHAGYTQQQTTSHQPPQHQQTASHQPRSIPCSVVTSMPPNTAKYTTAQRQSAPNYTHPYRQGDPGNTVRHPSSSVEQGFRPASGHFSPSTRNPALETDSCRNPFELPPPSSYPRAQVNTSVIKSHHQNVRLEDTRQAQRPGLPPYQQQPGSTNSDSVALQRYAIPPTRSEPIAISASEERPRPPPISARFPPVPQMNYDLQRQIYDRMTGNQNAPPRFVEKGENKRSQASHISNDRPISTLVSTTAPSIQSRQKKESPLDLSVKTVRQSADSTRDDVDLYVAKHFALESRMASAPKIDFTPNFASPLVQPESRSMGALPPVQTIRTFLPPPVEATSYNQQRKRPLPDPAEQAPPPKAPKVDAWKLAMDEQIEERLKAARQSRVQPTAALTPINPPLQSTTPTNPDLLRIPGYHPSSGYTANVPPRLESPADSAALHRSQLHEQMLQQMKKGRETDQNMRDWTGRPHPLAYPKDSVSITKVPSGFNSDPQRLVQQISQGVMPDSRLLQDRNVVDVLRNSLEEKEARLQKLQDAAKKNQRLPPFESMSIERIYVPPSYKHNAPPIAQTVKIGVEPTRNYMRTPGPERPQDGADLDGLAAFLAARIRTKGEMKQMGPSSAPFRSPVDQGHKPGASTVSPPKLAKEARAVKSPQRRRSGESLPVPRPRDPSGLRSSSETSVFDFRESDSEGEMPVLERQTLEGMRRDRKTQPKSSQPQSSEPEPGPTTEEVPVLEPDPVWDNACDMFVDQLHKRPIKRSVRKKKPNPKFFANESEAPGFMKVKPEEEPIKEDNNVLPEPVAEKEASKPVSVDEVKKELKEPDLPPLLKEEDINSSSSEELPLKAKSVKGKKASKSDSEWESSEASLDSNSSNSEVIFSISEATESEAESEPKGRGVQTRQQSRKIRPPARMKLRSKQRGAKKDDAFRPGWEDEVYKFKQKNRIPERLINVSKPRKRGTGSLPDIDSETDVKGGKSGKKQKQPDKKGNKGGKKGGKTGGKNKGKKEEKDLNIFKKKSEERPSSAPPLTRQNRLGIITRSKEKVLRSGASAAVRRSNKAVQNSKRHLNNDKTRLKLRRKFRSGFDYMRKKKKQPNRKEAESEVTEVKSELKRKERTDGVDLKAEVKSWVVNKGAGETVLHRAARLGYADVAAYCLDKMKMNPSPRDHAEYTPLHEACSRGHLLVAKVLLQYGANVSESARGGVRPLHQAAENNYKELVRLLLSFGADPLIATYTGQTALSLTTQDDVRELITQHLADVQGKVAPKWCFEGPAAFFADPEWSVNPLADPPSPDLVPIEIEIEASSRLLPPLYRLPDDESDERWLLVQDLVAYTRSLSEDALLSKLPGTTRREITGDDFRDKASCFNIMSAPHATGRQVQLVRYDEAVRQILDVELLTVSLLVDE